MRAAVVGHGHGCIMHGAKATAIGCMSDCEVLDSLIQAIPAHEFLFGAVDRHCGHYGLRVSVACVWVRIDHCCLDRIHAESDGECTGLGGPSDLHPCDPS